MQSYWGIFFYVLIIILHRWAREEYEDYVLKEVRNYRRYLLAVYFQLIFIINVLKEKASMYLSTQLINIPG